MTGPIGKSEAPKNAPAARYFTTSSRTRPAGLTSRYRSVPRFASPAMVSPATTPTVIGRNNGTETTRAAIPTNSPFCVIRSRNGGPSPGAGLDDDSRTATATRIGIAASASKSAHVRRRRKSTESSEAIRAHPTEGRAGPVVTSSGNVEPLTGQGHEALLETRVLHEEAGNTHATGHQGLDDRLGFRCPVRHRGAQQGVTLVGRRALIADGIVGDALVPDRFVRLETQPNQHAPDDPVH